MKEKLESIDFENLSMSEANDILNELLTYDGEEFKENIFTIIDNWKFTQPEDEINEAVEFIFTNERVRNFIDSLVDEYDNAE